MMLLFIFNKERNEGQLINFSHGIPNGLCKYSPLKETEHNSPPLKPSFQRVQYRKGWGSNFTVEKPDR